MRVCEGKVMLFLIENERLQNEENVVSGVLSPGGVKCQDLASKEQL